MWIVDGAGDAWLIVPGTMEKSMNGWPASPDPNDLDLVWITVATRKFRVKRVAAPLFEYAIRRWHLEVSPITGGVMGEWSYAYRVIRGSTSGTLSNHSSGDDPGEREEAGRPDGALGGDAGQITIR